MEGSRRQNSHRGKSTTLVSQITNYKRLRSLKNTIQEPAEEKQPLQFLNQDLKMRKGPRVCFSTCPGTHGAWALTWCVTSQKASSNLSTMASSDQGDLPWQMFFLSATPWLPCPWPYATSLICAGAGGKGMSFWTRVISLSALDLGDYDG